MKIILLLVSAMIFACNSTVRKSDPLQTNTAVTIKTAIDSKTKIESVHPAYTGSSLTMWQVDFTNKTKLRNPNFKAEYLKVDIQIKALNKLYPQIKLEKARIIRDTLITKISDSKYLTERMGTDGAAEYLAQVIINLTSIDKMKWVRINFHEGSHASPGIWSANDFSDYGEIR